LKIWLKDCVQAHCKPRYPIRYAAGLLSSVLLIGLIYYIASAEPKICALCGSGDGTAYHAPCLLNLATGKMGEMRVFDYRPETSLELSERQQTGTFSFLYIDGEVSAYRDTCDQSSHATLPAERPSMKKRLFCSSCRQILFNVNNSGYVIADLYDLSNVQVFSVQEGMSYQIREYNVLVQRHKDTSDRLSVDVFGIRPDLLYVP